MVTARAGRIELGEGDVDPAEDAEIVLEEEIAAENSVVVEFVVCRGEEGAAAEV